MLIESAVRPKPSDWLWGVLVMQRLPHEFCRALSVLGLIEGASLGDPKFAEQPIDDDSLRTLLDALAGLNKSCEAIAAKLTLNASQRLIARLESEKRPTVAQAVNAIAEIRSRFQDELDDRVLLGLTQFEAAFCVEPEKLFGEKICEKFGSEDLEEAALCLSLGRNTACVFHLMRAMECSVKVLGSKLCIDNVDKEWGKILSDISSKIQAMPKGEARDRWSECHANLYHVKQAWRNKTMHPKRTYTDEQAHDVLKAVKAFLAQLVTLL